MRYTIVISVQGQDPEWIKNIIRYLYTMTKPTLTLQHIRIRIRRI